MRLFGYSLFVFLLFVFSSSVSFAQMDLDMMEPGHLYVQFTVQDLSPAAGKTGIEAFDQRAEHYGIVSLEKAFPSLEVIAANRPISPEVEALRRVYQFRYSSPYLPMTVAEELESVPQVAYAEPIFRHELIGLDTESERLADPNDSFYSQQTHLLRLNLPSAWDIVKGEDADVVIGIVDGGTEWRHEDLIDNVWTNPNEIADNGIDDDNNGFVDDIHGWNFNEDKPDPAGPANSGNAWHGTAVAGTAAATTNNSLGVAGSSWNAMFMGINTSCDDQSLLCHTSEGVLYAGLNGADVINASFGGSYFSQTMLMILDAVMAEGALLVASSGNGGTDNDVQPSYPANYPGVLSVGGIEKNSDKNVFNYGSTVNVYAAGLDVETTSLPTDAYSNANGTSFSSPLVSGVAALVKTAFPQFGPDQVREQIRLTAVNIDSSNPGKEGKMGRGRVDAHAAVTQDPLPAIRVAKVEYSDAGGEDDIESGETLIVRITFTNHHGDGENISVELTTDAPYVTFVEQKQDLGSMKRGDMRVADFSMMIGSGAARNALLYLRPRITVGSLVDTPDLLTIPINASAASNHSTAALTVSVTDEGNIGHSIFEDHPSSAGTGFIVTTAAGATEDVLYEGGLMIATSRDTFSDCIRGPDTRVQDEDFLPLSTIQIVKPGRWTSEEGRVAINDSGAPIPIGIQVLQESFIDDKQANEDFLILSYTITNRSGGLIEDMFVGLFFDWDLSFDFLDFAAFDMARRTGYFMDSETSETVVTGARLLSDGDLNYDAIDNENEIYDDFTNQEKWESLSSGVRQNGTNSRVADLAQVIGSGPHTLEVGASLKVAFAVIAGTSESDFLSNADNAAMLWQHIGTSTNPHEVPEDEFWSLRQPFPHPATAPVEMNFETGASADVLLEVYDLLGRRIRTVLDGQHPKGGHSVSWDGRNGAGLRVAQGLYVIRMTAQSGEKVYTRSRPLMIVR